MRVVDLTGQTIGRLKVIRRAPNTPEGKASWVCVCRHGGKGDPVEIVVPSVRLRGKGTRSCGCIRRERGHRLGRSWLRHGMTGTPLYQCWVNMVSRCSYKRAQDYPRYGGRGIRVCKSWMVSDNFFGWALSSGYRKGLTIERKNLNGNYCPSNCTWIPKRDQRLNKYNVRVLIWRGRLRTASECAQMEGLPVTTVLSRIRTGWSYRDALTYPSRQGFRPEQYKGISHAHPAKR